MSKPAKDEPALLKRAGEAIRKALIKPPGCTESTGCAVGPCHCAHLAAEASIAAIRAAGWAVVPVEPVCVNAHDRCYGGAGGPCPYCEMPAAPGVKP
jgi:hypothetical protein